MAFAMNGPVRIHYQRMAAGTGPVVILLAGAGRPSTDFDYGFCAPIMAAGFVPIRIDSRDTGRSAAMTGAMPDLHAVKGAALGAGTAQPPYGIADMAADVLAVMDAESVVAAHFVGRSIGGLVAQQLAVRHSDRVLSLALVMAMSRSMADAVPDAALDRLMAENIPDEDAYVARRDRTPFRRKPCRPGPARGARRGSRADVDPARPPRQGDPAGTRLRDRRSDPKRCDRSRRDDGP